MNVQDIRQGKFNACGDAVVDVMLAYHGLPAPHASSNDRRFYQGLRPSDLSRQLRARGLQAFGLAPAVPGTLSVAEHATCRVGIIRVQGNVHA